MKKYLLLLLLILITPLAIAVDWHNEGATVYSTWLGIEETVTPPARTNTGKIYTKNDNSLYFQDGAGTEHTVSLDVVVAAAQIGSPAAEEIGAAGTYEPLPLALTESMDSAGNWAVTSENYYCYSGSETLSNAIVSFDFSSSKTEQSSTQTITYKIGKDSSSNLPLADGDEIGPDYDRSYTNVGDSGLGGVVYVGSINTNDCVGLMMTTDGSTPTIQANGGILTVRGF